MSKRQRCKSCGMKYKKKSGVNSLSGSELASVLAGLRLLSDIHPAHQANSMPGFFDDCNPLTEDELDALCQRLNFGSQPSGYCEVEVVSVGVPGR